MEHSSHNMSTIVLLGSEALKRLIVRLIIGDQEDCQRVSSECSDCKVAQSKDFRVVIAPDIFDKNNKYVDQHVIDLMALSLPGPHIFILAIDQQNEEETRKQIEMLHNYFGDMSQNFVVIFRDIESFLKFKCLEKEFNILLTTANEKLDSMCREWCGRKPFIYKYNNYSEVVVKSRSALFRPRSDDAPVSGHDETAAAQPQSADSSLTHGLCVERNDSFNQAVAGMNVDSRPSDDPPVSGHDETAAAQPQSADSSLPHGWIHDDVNFTAGHDETAAAQPQSTDSSLPHDNSPDIRRVNIILLGLTGTGKSASANTILKEFKSNTKFESRSDSLPTTKKCQSETVKYKKQDIELMVVDTPDFFHESIQNCEEQLEECKKYLKSDHYVVLLVIKVGRFTDQEMNILEKLEKKLDVTIRDKTFLLLTGGKDLKKRKVIDVIKENEELQKIADQCSHRHHVFENQKKHSKQVQKLFEKMCHSNLFFVPCKK
ncbi:uncharacterized protein LOC110159908 isoform X2 [Boleophthalmus pectinirostris]|uniref:uncharacterized protein LOC110159908 isoform X2 n=1 Tax=Boleophthalmus pectinirostris TaxID=150288 RepID=UPI00242E75A1|nr:uncharacterized protein LOC110159908 isoform X2 [Boleophthalmus pectinirostris]